MILARHALIAVLAFALLPFVGTAKAPQVSRDWSRTYTVTANGGFRVGKPDAAVAVVEYGSLTCPHCRRFAETAVKPLLLRYVRTGKASYEFRPFVLNDLDLAAILLARCSGPARFFPMAESLYASQSKWIDRFEALSDDENRQIAQLPGPTQRLKLAEVTRLFPIAAAHGIPAAKAKTCLTSNTEVSQLQAIYDAALAAGVKGTPTIFVNGTMAESVDWANLEPLLKAHGT